MGLALGRLAEEDPTFPRAPGPRPTRPSSPAAASSMDIIVDRMHREFNRSGHRRQAGRYHQTIRKKVESENSSIKQTGAEASTACGLEIPSPGPPARFSSSWRFCRSRAGASRGSSSRRSRRAFSVHGVGRPGRLPHGGLPRDRVRRKLPRGGLQRNGFQDRGVPRAEGRLPSRRPDIARAHHEDRRDSPRITWATSWATIAAPRRQGGAKARNVTIIGGHIRWRRCSVTRRRFVLSLKPGQLQHDAQPLRRSAPQRGRGDRREDDGRSREINRKHWRCSRSSATIGKLSPVSKPIY